MRLINLDDILKQFPKADFDGDDLENMKAYPHWKTDITGLFTILKSVPIIEPCEDAISREEVLRHRHVVQNNDWIGCCVVRVDEITKLPSVTPKAESEETMHFNSPTHEGYTERCNHTQSEGAYDE